jgi:large subunit ribosomal protein L9
MEVILMERVEKLGQMGDIVTVKPGFARNFLLPRGKAMRATEENKKVFEAQRAQLEADNLKRKTDAEAVAAKMDGTKIVLIRSAGEAGQLYGSVAARDVAGALADAGFTVNRGQVDLGHPIKALGLYDVAVSLHPEVAVTVTANVARSAEEAELQAETGQAAIASTELEEEEAPELEALVDEDTAEHIHEEEVEEAAEEAAAEEAPAEAEAEPEAEAAGDEAEEKTE